jgi:hypothetical protein
MQPSKFEATFKKVMESMDTGSVFGATPTSQFSGDTYAPGDARIPEIIGAKKKKKKIPILRRSFPQGM